MDLPDYVVVPPQKYVDAYLPTPEIVLGSADRIAPLKGAALFTGECLGNSFESSEPAN